MTVQDIQFRSIQNGGVKFEVSGGFGVPLEGVADALEDPVKLLGEAVHNYRTCRWIYKTGREDTDCSGEAANLAL